MPKKDSNAAVLGMLSSRGSQFRPAASSDLSIAHVDEDADDQAQVGDLLEAAQPQQADPQVEAAPARPTPAREVTSQRAPGRRQTTTSSRARKTTGGDMTTETTTQQQAPRTIRLSQTMATQLREAWIEARRAGDVLLSYQDFADDIIDQGLTADLRRRK